MQDLPVDRLGAFPILQLAAAVLVLGGLAIAIWKATRDRKAIQSVIPEEQRWFFDGPLALTINLIRDVKNHQSRQVEISEAMVEEVRHQSNILRDIKNELQIISRTRKL